MGKTELNESIAGGLDQSGDHRSVLGGSDLVAEFGRGCEDFWSEQEEGQTGLSSHRMHLCVSVDEPEPVNISAKGWLAPPLGVQIWPVVQSDCIARRTLSHGVSKLEQS